MEYYLDIRDIQTLGMLACVLTHNALSESFKPAKPHFGNITGSKSFTYGISSPACDSPTHQVIFVLTAYLNVLKMFKLCLPQIFKYEKSLLIVV